MDMTNKDRKITHEEFKAGLLEWKNRHTDEYNRFARQMRSGDAAVYIRFYADIIRRLPGLGKQWRRDWDSDGVVNFDNMVMAVSASAVPQVILDDYYTQKDLPLQEGPEKITSLQLFPSYFGLEADSESIHIGPAYFVLAVLRKEF